MTLAFVVLAAFAVFAIAAVVIGREARRLAAEPPRPVFDFEDAVAWVCRHVPDRVAAELTPDDVRQIINWHLEYFRRKGVSSNGSSPHGTDDVVVGLAETVDYVLTRSDALGSEYTPEQVHAVLAAQMTYLETIGAVGPASDRPPRGPGRPEPE